MDATEVTATELRGRVHGPGRRISRFIEHTADTIAYNTTDPEIRSVTLRWKLGAIPLIEEASNRKVLFKRVLDAVRAERMATLAAADSIAFATAGRLLLWVFVGLLVVAIVGAIGAGGAVRALRS
jgi:hypothetical protein